MLLFTSLGEGKCDAYGRAESEAARCSLSLKCLQRRQIYRNRKQIQGCKVSIVLYLQIPERTALSFVIPHLLKPHHSVLYLDHVVAICLDAFAKVFREVKGLGGQKQSASGILCGLTCVCHTRLMEVARLKCPKAEKSAVQSVEEGRTWVEAWLKGESVLHSERGVLLGAPNFLNGAGSCRHTFQSCLLTQGPHSAAIVHRSVF